jgi:hypothetical protein
VTEAPLGEGRPVIDEPPPVLGTWPRVYVFVLCYLAVVIGLFAIFTAYFKPAP